MVHLLLNWQWSSLAVSSPSPTDQTLKIHSSCSCWYWVRRASDPLTLFYSLWLWHYRKAVRLAQLAACRWQGYDPVPSPTGPTSTPQPPAPLPLPPPPHIARPSAVPPPTTGSDDTATSVSLCSGVFILKVLQIQVRGETPQKMSAASIRNVDHFL